MVVNYVSKKYGSKQVLDNISLNIKKGEVVGLVGNNGAGKSTLMKILSQTQPVFEGQIDEKCKVGYFIENPKLFEKKTGIWNLRYFSSIYGERFNIEKYNVFFEEIGIRDVLNKKVKTYSLGMKEKLGVAISLLNNPEFVILDEPTNGMDIESSLSFLENIRKFANKQHVGFLISSHKLEDIDQICDRVLFLDNCHLSEEKNMTEKQLNEVVLVFGGNKEAKTFVEKQSVGRLIDVSDNIVKLESSNMYLTIIKELQELDLSIIDYYCTKKTLRNIYMEKVAERKKSNEV